MERIVVVSTNNNPDYYFFSPYIKRAWNKLGWKVAIMITHDTSPNMVEADYIIRLPEIKGLREATIAQAGRLYAANYLGLDNLIMTSDMDLLPLKDYWNPDPNDITVYGHDLTWRSFYPMGYCAMTGENWKKIMRCTLDTAHDLERDAKEIGIAYSQDWEQWWNHDWTLLTARLKPIHNSLRLIDRGQIDIAGATLAKGRVDRYNWEETMKQPDWIDAHCDNHNVRNEEKLAKFLKVFEKVYGKI